jgi:heme/copper-type cytochrome/quinol oxidase subunit 2
MRNLQRLGATVALLLGSAWWAAVAVVARAGMAEADTIRGQLLWLAISTVAIVAAALFIYFALAFRPADEDLELELELEPEPEPEPLPSHDRGRNKRAR